MQQKQTEPYLSAYLHGKGYRLGLPISGNFELTARCNFNCPMCYVHMSEAEVNAAGKELTAQQWIDIAREAKEKGMVFALLTGGEPFIRKDFFEIYGAMKRMGLVVSINSNGSMLEGKILEQLIADPPSRMNISLYGGCNETYKKMCGLPMYDKVLKNIITLKEHGIDVRINLSITPYNCDDLERIYKIVKEYNIQVKASSYMYPPARLEKEIHGYGNRLSSEASAKYSVKWDQLRLSKEEFKLRAENIKNLVSVDSDECASEMEEGIHCRAGSSTFWMTWDGQMRPCGMMPYPTTYPFEVGFDRAWNTLLEETKKIKQPSKCISCNRKDVCGVCAAVCVSETGDFQKVPKYMCKRTDEMIRFTWERYMEMKGTPAD